MAKKAATPDPNEGLGARKDSTLEIADAEQVRGELARLLVSPELAALRAIRAAEGTHGYGAHLDPSELANCFRKQVAAVNSGDLAQVEAMLLSQAIALQTLFARLLERGMAQDTIPQYEAHMRLALRAQAQGTRTLEVLASVKNPPVVFAKQANFAHQQQVNNGPAVPDPARARNPESSQNKLLEPIPDERLECGTAGAPSGADTPLATVGTVHRPPD